MRQIGVWEQSGGLAEQVARLAEGLGLVRACSHPGLLAGVELDLLVVAPDASGWAGAPAILCRTALVPGGLSPLSRWLPPCRQVSYGMSPRDTVTLSSLYGGSAAIAVQREFLTLDGTPVEQGELVLPCPHTSPEPVLVLAATALLLGRL